MPGFWKCDNTSRCQVIYNAIIISQILQNLARMLGENGGRESQAGTAIFKFECGYRIARFLTVYVEALDHLPRFEFVSFNVSSSFRTRAAGTRLAFSSFSH